MSCNASVVRYELQLTKHDFKGEINLKRFHVARSGGFIGEPFARGSEILISYSWMAPPMARLSFDFSGRSYDFGPLSAFDVILLPRNSCLTSLLDFTPRDTYNRR